MRKALSAFFFFACLVIVFACLVLIPGHIQHGDPVRAFFYVLVLLFNVGSAYVNFNNLTKGPK